jgi:hypothetical protein
MKQILHNRIKCKKCGDVIESMYRHDFKFCKCGFCSVDGGQDYLRRGWKEGNPAEAWEDRSEFVKRKRKKKVV